LLYFALCCVPFTLPDRFPRAHTWAISRRRLKNISVDRPQSSAMRPPFFFYRLALLFSYQSFFCGNRRVSGEWLFLPPCSMVLPIIHPPLHDSFSCCSTNTRVRRQFDDPEYHVVPGQFRVRLFFLSPCVLSAPPPFPGHAFVVQFSRFWKLTSETVPPSHLIPAFCRPSGLPIPVPFFKWVKCGSFLLLLSPYFFGRRYQLRDRTLFTR